ncbi:MAG TPA: TonB family protein [Sphingomicrobium sp.]|nr:TonB family protein [Sphingomicrobium sp.]
MYRNNLGKKDRSGAIALVAAIHAALGFAFLNMSGTIDLADPQRVMRVFDVREIVPPKPPPPPPPPPPPQVQQPRPKEREGGSAPRNIRSEATPIVAPRPRVELPVPPVVAVTETPREGAAPTQGASDVRGPGTGAGGTGTGTGSGSGGSGTGGGGSDGGIATRAQLLTPSLRSRDYPPHLRSRWPRGAGVLVTFTVEPTGRVSNCRVYESSGDSEIDNMTCMLVTQRFVYRPALNRRGEAVTSQAGYRQGD